ncbi:MAG: hypothetical protein ACJ74H_18490, partial [Thermoanaerobaculia bacterium]
MRTSVAALTLAGLISSAAALAQTPPAVALIEDFQSYGAQRQPPGWVDSSLGNASNASGLDKTWPDPTQPNKGSNIVFGTKQSSGRPDGNTPKIGTFSTLTSKTFDATGRFEYRGRFIRTNSDTRIGLTFFASMYDVNDPTRGVKDYYLLGLWKQPGSETLTMQLFSSAESVLTGTRDSAFTPAINTWYRFLIQADDVDGSTKIRARIWADGSAEPSTWMLDATDATATRFTSGHIGLWAAVKGDAYIDDLNVKSPVDFTPPVLTLFESGVPLDPAVVTNIGHAAIVEARAADVLSGTAQTTLTVDGNPYTALSPYSVEGPHTFRAKATDHAGNISEL